MITFKRLINPSFLYLLGLVLSATLFLNSCGGGAAAFAGVGSGGTGVVVQGLVTGFGSVFIDGKEYPYSNVSVTEDDINHINNQINATFSLGQIVRATIDGNGNLTSANVLPELQGPVTTAPTSITSNTNEYPSSTGSGDFFIYVLNQKVRIVANAANTALGITTVLYSPSNAITINDLTQSSEVVVHGVWVYDSVTSENVLIATRIEQTATSAQTASTAPTSNVEISGVVVAAPNTSQNTIQINSTASGTIVNGMLPSGIQQNQTVSIVVTRANWNAYVANQNNPLVSSLISITSLTQQSISASQTVQLSGLISNYDSVSNTAYIQGVKVTLPSGVTVHDGDYIRLSGSVANGELEHDSVNPIIQTSTSVTSQVIQVIGVTNGINFPQATANSSVSFVLQGISITAAAGNYPTCAGLGVGNTELISVTGTQTTPGNPLVASLVTCQTVSNSSSGLVVDYSGSVNTTIQTQSGTFTLTTENKSYTINFNSNTYIDPTIQNISISQAEIIGVVQSDGSILASTIKAVKTDGSRIANND